MGRVGREGGEGKKEEILINIFIYTFPICIL